METRNIAIMLTDIKGFTSKTSSSSRAETQELLTRHRELVLPVIEKFHGRLVKTIGDAFLVAFNSPTDAVICGMEIQDVLKKHNSDKAHPEKIEIRIAINSGEVAIHDDGDIYGDAVNITARLESIAEAGEVFFTEAVYLAMNKREVPSSEIGYRQFKGIPEKIKVFRVLRETPVGAQPLAEVIPDTGAAPVPAAAAPAAAAAIPQFQPAGIIPRAVSLFLDLFLFVVIFSFSTGIKHWGVDVNQAVPGIKNINFSDKGVNLSNAHGTRKLDASDLKTKSGDEHDGDNEWSGFPFSTLFWVLYLTIFLKRKGATLGMLIMKLKLIDIETGLTPKKTLWRAVFSVVSAIPLGLGYFWAFWKKDHRTWHDLIAGTRVVKNN